jgi:hypothetical protein
MAAYIYSGSGSGRISLWLPSFPTWPISYCRRAASRHIRQPIAVFSSLCVGPHRLLTAGGATFPCAALRLVRLRAVAPSVAGTSTSLSRPLPRQRPRRQVLRGGHRRLSNGGLSGPPQTTSWEGPAVSGSAPSPRPAFPVAWQLILHRLSPWSRLGGGGRVVWRRPARLRVLEKSASKQQ